MPYNIYNNLAVRMTGGTSTNPHLELYEGSDGALSIVIDDDSQVNILHTGSNVGSQRVAIGKGPTVSGQSAVGIGNGVNSWGSSSTAVGNGASAELGFTTAIGGSSVAEVQNSTAIGYNARVDTTGQHGIALGYNSHAANWDTLAIGRSTNATGNGSIIIGHAASSATNSVGNSLALTWDDGTTSFLFRKGGDTYLNGGDVVIGTTVANAKLHVQGVGNTDSSEALLIENTDGNDLLTIDDAGNTVFNEAGLDANFRVETDTEVYGFYVDGGNNNVGIGAIPNANRKFDVFSSSEGRTITAYIESNPAAAGSTGLQVYNAANGSGSNGITSISTATAGIVRGFNSAVQTAGSSHNYGVYSSARNGSTRSCAYYGEVVSETTNPSNGSYGMLLTNTSANATNKYGVWSQVGSGPDNGTSYSYYALGDGTPGNDSTVYGYYSITNVTNSASGVTSYAAYLANYGSNTATTYYGIVLGPHAGSTTPNSGFGTLTPSATLDVVGSFQYVDGNEGAGKVLTSDANGNAIWSASTGGSTISKYSTTTAFTASVTKTITHSLGTSDIVVELWDTASAPARVDATVEQTNGDETNSLDITFSTGGSYKVVVIG
jgi:hypothetical protein